jgi:galactokinase
MVSLRGVQHVNHPAAGVETTLEGARLFMAPGRVNIIGEHTDHNDGLVLPTNTALYTRLTVTPRMDRTVQAVAENFDDKQSFSLDDIRRSDRPGWLDYLKGVAALLQAEGVRISGADITISGDIPLGSGLSSSASLELATAVALLEISGATMPAENIALLCQQAEHQFAGVQCGIMDQFSVACCNRGEAMLLDCRNLNTTPVPLPDNLGMLLTDSGATHRLTDSGYNDRAAECQQAVELISAVDPEIQSLRDLPPSSLAKYADQLGDTLYRRSRHVVSEIERVTDACVALRASDIDKLGQLISASHASLRDDFEVSCSEIESLVEIADACNGVTGSRMVGGGFGGCVLSVMPANKLEEAADQITAEYGAIIGKTPWVHVVSSADPAGEVDPS